jgi:hypothetical protein
MRHLRRHLLALFGVSLSFPAICNAQQLWTDVLSPSRAINWSNVGIPGGLPDTKWTQCTTAACKVVCPGGTNPCGSGGSVTVANINAAISSASAQEFILIPAGTFSGLTGSINLKNQTVVRGMGANQTFLVFSSAGSCNGLNSQFSMCGSMSYTGGQNTEQNIASWTAGFSQNATQVTLSNSKNIVAGSTVITLDQQDAPYDTGQVWSNAQKESGNDGSGGARQDGTCSSSVSPFVGFCTQQQSVLVTACSPSCNNSGSTVLTITPGLYASNWNNPQVTGSTGAFWATSFAYQEGVEDLSADLSGDSNPANTVVMMNAYECWLSGVRSINAGTQAHVWLFTASRSIIRDNYFYGSASHQTQSYGNEIYAGSSDNLFENNIYQQMTDSTPNNNGGGMGNVGAYNFAIMDIFYNGAGGWFQPSDYEHSGGAFYWLREGNDDLGLIDDNVHGTHAFTTAFRNRYPGWEVAGCQIGSTNQTNTPCVSNTTAINMFAASRYINIVGNVLGQAGYFTNYTATAPANNQNSSIYYLGGSPGGGAGSPGFFCSNPASCAAGSGPYTTSSDPLTQTSILRWGNWDTVTAGCTKSLNCSSTVRWCGNSSNSGWSTTCNSISETASGFADASGTPSIYTNLIPGSTNLPNSFFLTASTTTSTSPCGTGLSWWLNPTLGTCPPFPAIGPDVTGGNMVICSAGTYANSYSTTAVGCAGGGTPVTAFGGHANANPAMTCYLSVMHGPPDGTGGVLSFNRASCYAADSASSATPPPPTGITGSVVTQ